MNKSTNNKQIQIFHDFRYQIRDFDAKFVIFDACSLFLQIELVKY